MAPETKPTTVPTGFTLIRKGRNAPVSEQRPPDSLLETVEDGTVIAGPDNVQWVAMAAVPRRWERSKKPIGTSRNQSGGSQS